MKVEIKNVTPEFASLLLEQNDSNRKINKNQLDMLCRTIESGHWRLTHQGVAIYEDGTLADGQHRLSAIVKTGIACKMPLFYGIKKEESLIMAIDSGKPRSITDSSTLTGSKVTPLDKSLINGLEFGYTSKGFKKLTHHETLNLHKKHQEALSLSNELFGLSIKKCLTISPVRVAIVESVLSEDVTSGFAKLFAESLITGEYEDNRLINAVRLRNKLMSYNYSGSGGRATAYFYTKNAITKAFNGIELKRFK